MALIESMPQQEAEEDIKRSATFTDVVKRIVLRSNKEKLGKFSEEIGVAEAHRVMIDARKPACQGRVERVTLLLSLIKDLEP